MPGMDDRGPKRVLVVVVIAVLVFGFAPISRTLLRSVHGSFAPSSYSALALKVPSDAVTGVIAGNYIRVQLMNHTGQTKTYHWSASQKGALIGLGVETVGNDQATTIFVPSRGAASGRLQIQLTGTNVFITVPILGTGK